MNRRSRIGNKNKIRSHLSLRRRTAKKHTASMIIARNNTYHLRILKEVDTQTESESENTVTH